MRLLILTASLWALALAKPEMYKESEDFQYSRSSSDEGTKSGFYGAQRGNMGGNYEKAHNMDSMAQHHMSTLVRQIDGELGEGANTKTGSVFTAGNSRGIYGSGNYDLTNLKGRNFGENGAYGESQSQSSLYQDARSQGNSYATNNARYGSEQSLSSNQRSGYSASNLAAQYSNSDLTSENKYHGASNYDYGALEGSNTRYYSVANSQARGAYDHSNTNLHSTYDLNNQNRFTSTTPVKVYIRPGGRVAVPVSAPTYTLYSSNLQDKNVADTTNVLSNSGSEISYKPTNNAKHYESSYRYHKKWEKHDTQPQVVVPTENPYPANSELYEDRQLDQTGERYQSELDSSNTHLSNDNRDYSAHQNYQSGIASADVRSSKTNSAYSSGYSANTKTASASQQARYQSEAQNKATSSTSNTYSLDTHNSGTSSTNLNNLVEDINSRPKNYHSSFSYHKAWERRGDPYVIIPSGEVSGQQSQRLTAASQNQGQYSSQHYGSHYNQKSYSNIDCDAICHERRKRSYNINQYEQDLNSEQQSENGWDLGQQTENKFENLEDLGQVAQSTWDNFENLGQQTQNKWDNLQNVGQETQNKWNNLEDNSGQQTQNNWDHLADLGQQAQSEWSNQDDLGQKTENQRPQLENFGQETQEQAQGEWSKLEDLGQQTQSQWGALEHETQSKWDAAGQETLNKMDNLGQETQSDWSKLEDLGQQKQNNWGKQQDFGQAHTGDLEEKKKTNTEDKNNIISEQKKIIPIVETNEPANHKFLWDAIDQMFEEPSKTENGDKNFEHGENLLNHDNKDLFDIDKTPTNKQPNNDQLLQHNNNKEKISTTLNKNQQPQSTVSLTHFEPKDVPDKQTHENTPTNPFEIGHNQGTDLDQQSENLWGDFGQQSENHWSNLGQESENPWSNLGQQSQNQWSNLGQESENHWSNLGQESENPWNNLGQQSENQWSNLDQQSENHWSNLGQQSENHWNNLGQQSENHWSNLGQQSENHWSVSSQQTQNVWGHLDQQNQFSSQHQYFNQDKSFAEDKEKTEVTHNVEDKNLKEFLETIHQMNNWSHHSQTNEQNQDTTKDTENFHGINKDLVTGDSTSVGNHNVEQLHDFNITSSKLPKETNEKQDTINSETTTEVQSVPNSNRDTANIGRGDIGADDDSYEFGTHNKDEQDKPNLIVSNLPSTIVKPTHNEYGKSYSHVLINPSNYNVPEEKPNSVALSSQKLEEQQTVQQQFEQQNLNLQQEDLSVLPAHLDYKSSASPSPNPSIQLGRSLESVPLEKNIQEHDLIVRKHNEFVEQVPQQVMENIESSPKKNTETEPLEPIAEKTGFWSSVWNKTKKAKNSVVSWFKN